MSRGNRREAIFRTDADRKLFLDLLGQTCRRTGWEIHAYRLMDDHFHLVLETPRPNLAAEMQWLPGPTPSDSIAETQSKLQNLGEQ